MTDLLTLDDFDAWWLSQPTDFAFRENPREEDSRCQYTAADGRHCVAGQFLADHGLVVPDANTEFPEDEDQKYYYTTPNTTNIAELAKAFDLPLEDELVDRLANLQSYADDTLDRRTWGAALDRALEVEADDT